MYEHRLGASINFSDATFKLGGVQQVHNETAQLFDTTSVKFQKPKEPN